MTYPEETDTHCLVEKDLSRLVKEVSEWPKCKTKDGLNSIIDDAIIDCLSGLVLTTGAVKKTKKSVKKVEEYACSLAREIKFLCVLSACINKRKYYYFKRGYYPYKEQIDEFLQKIGYDKNAS